MRSPAQSLYDNSYINDLLYQSNGITFQVLSTTQDSHDAFPREKRNITYLGVPVIFERTGLLVSAHLVTMNCQWKQPVSFTGCSCPRGP